MLTGHKTRDGFHRARAIQGDNRGDILDRLRFQPQTNPGHTRRLHLEYTGGTAGRQHLKYRRIVHGDLAQIKVRLMLTHHLHRIVQHRQIAQT